MDGAQKTKPREDLAAVAGFYPVRSRVDSVTRSRHDHHTQKAPPEGSA